MSDWSVRPYGPRAALVEVDDALTAAGLASWGRTAGLGAGDIVPAAATVLFDGISADELRTRLPEVLPTEQGHSSGHVVVPVRFDGPDLERVALAWDRDVAGVVALLTATEFIAAFSGFAPGFAYLSGLPASLSLPRLDVPRPRVEPGSVALADSWAGIYPSASPGGWLLVGSTDAALWDVTRAAPALIVPGATVSFEAL